MSIFWGEMVKFQRATCQMLESRANVRPSMFNFENANPTSWQAVESFNSFLQRLANMLPLELIQIGGSKSFNAPT